MSFCQPGLSRYCTVPSSSDDGVDQREDTDDGSHQTVVWATRSLATTTCTTVQAFIINGHDGNHHRCKIEWLFVSDPVEGWRLEDFISYLHSCLQLIANKDGAFFSMIFIV
ncbi:hypothetical protein Pyn_05745 [Prunus yedoensis var. nudiflora]|uniref:Uncharacterized protein n=1 Tax=Prunus yedoensis var. nudiflora TaxID=2094558 RepID=A0A314Y891_PRUYE|nr:hypothetical protein Pyn_05745 [Prunus yedoensis var. nudiflora]